MEALQKQIGPYSLHEVLGRGGMGVVYRAEHSATGQFVALKTVRAHSEGSQESLRREIQALARLRNPQIVRIFDHGLHEGLLWYAMELLQGTSLRRFASNLHGWSETLEIPGSTSDTPDQIQRASAGTSSSPTGPPTPDVAQSSLWSWNSSTGSRVEAPPEEPARSPDSGAATTGSQPRPQAAGGRLIEVLDLVRRLCAPLAYLHGEGLVHRDLKLDNILLRSEKREERSEKNKTRGTEQQADSGIPATDPTPSSLTSHSSLLTSPVLVDFGLMSRFSADLAREELEVGFFSAGTVHTMAPEQTLGELVDARADLYALGCVLYELLTGRPPFLGKTPLQIARSHLTEIPQPPSALVEGISPPLDALVLRLLEKQPRQRFGYASDVAVALEAVGASSFFPTQAPAPRSYLYRPGFVGREEPLEQLRQLRGSALEGRTSLVLVGGESGIGKTRLALELARESERMGLRVLAGISELSAGLPGGSSQAALLPLRGVLRAIAGRCREVGTAEVRRLLGPHGPLLARYEPELHGLPGINPADRPPDLPPEDARRLLFEALGQTLGAFARVRPLLLLLDDLQWADELTLGFLESLARGQCDPSGAPLLILGTYRTEEDLTPLQPLLRMPQVARIRLERLAQSAVARMIGNMLALEPAPEIFSRHLASHSEGNPFFVAEYLRSAVEQDLLYRDVAGFWQAWSAEETQSVEAVYQALPLPRSLRDLVHRRLEGLSALARDIAQAAAVLGREFEEALLLRMSRSSDDHALLDALGELTNHHILEEPAAGRLRFVHDKLREEAYGQLLATQRSQLHRQAAEVLEAQAGTGHAAALGRHWEMAGEPDRARPCYFQAAREAYDRVALQEAERLYQACLRISEASTEPSAIQMAIDAGFELSRDIFYLQARIPEAIQALQEALAKARRLKSTKLEAKVLRQLGLMRLRSGHLQEAEPLLRDALEMYRQMGERQGEAAATSAMASLRKSAGDFPAAEALFQRALGLYQEVGNQAALGNVMGNLGSLRRQQGRLSEGLALFEQGLQLIRESNTALAEGTHLGNMGNLLADLGREEQAESAFLDALAIYRKLGGRRQEGQILGKYGHFLGQHQRFGEASSMLQQSLVLQRLAGDRREEGQVLGALGALKMASGELEEAHATLLQALHLNRETRYSQCEAWTLLDLAILERRVETALPDRKGDLDRAQQILEDQKQDAGVLWCLTERGHRLLASGNSAADLLLQILPRKTLQETEGPNWRTRRIEGLRLAQAAFETQPSVQLYQGELIEWLPLGLRRRLAADGKFELP